MLACCDALIAAQNAVIAAESHGIGSCYIGDVMEQYETHRELLSLPQYAFPVCMLVFGYPTREQLRRGYTTRFDEKYILFENRYRRLEAGEDFAETPAGRTYGEGVDNFAQAVYARKFSAEFSAEMRRSVRAMLKNWAEQCMSLRG